VSSLFELMPIAGLPVAAILARTAANLKRFNGD
jgi:hypothetical protein